MMLVSEKMMKLLKQYRKSINPPYSPKDYLTLGATLFILVAIFLTSNRLSQPQSVLPPGSIAANGPIVFKDLRGNLLPTRSDGIPYTLSPAIKIELTAPYPPAPPVLGEMQVATSPGEMGNMKGHPKKITPTPFPTEIPTPSLILSPSPTSSPTSEHIISPTPSFTPTPTPKPKFTTSYKLTEDLASLETVSVQPYISEPTVLNYEFKDKNPGIKHISVQFIYSDGTMSQVISRPIELVATPTPTPLVNAEPYGVNDWNFTDDAMKATQEAGITWMRIQVIWKQIEPVQGTFYWNSGATSRIDYYMSQVEKYGMKVTLTVYISPDWAKQTGLILPRPEPFAAFVKEVLNRYPGKIAAVEILSEENTGSWPNTKNRDAIFYVPILKAAYNAVKEVSPSTLVLTSSLWASPTGYLEDMYTQGAKDYFDVLNFHYYPNNNSPALNYTWLISHYRKVMQKYGDGNKPIWMTEFAWPIDDEPMGFRTSDLVSPQQQSDYLTYTLNASMKSGFIQKVFWYVLTGDDGMAMIHDTNYYDWRDNQPILVSSIGSSDTTLTVSNNTTTKSGTALKVDWTKAWPQNGTIIADSEQIKYTSLTASADGSSTIVQGLARGANGTTAATHTIGITVKNQDQTAGYKRQIYYTYKNFIQANSSWTASQVSSLPDVPLPASSALSITNPGFESGMTGWGGSLGIDNTQSHSGVSSAKVANATGMTVSGYNQGTITVESGKSYFLKAWVKIDPAGSGNMNAMVKLNLNNSSGQYITNVPSNYYIYTTNGDWREIHYPFAATSDTARIQILLSTNSGTGTAWFDDITIEPYDLTTR